MRRHLTGYLVASFGLFAAVATVSGDEPKGVIPYRVAVDGNVKITTEQGISTTRHTQAELDYRVARHEGGIDVAIDRFGMRALADGREVDYVEMSRSRVVSRRVDRPLDVRRAEAPPAMLPLFAQFDPPLVSIKLDEEGGELSRQAKDQGGPLLGAHIVDLTRLFHPKFPKGESKWEAPVVLPFGRGQVANGVLRYTKRPGEEKDGLVSVDVSGYLKVTGTHDGVEIKRGAYKVSGRQTFDPAANEWVAGKLTVAISFETQMPNGMVLRGNGPATFTLSRRAQATKTKGARKKSGT